MDTSPRGQAALEYVGALTLIAAVLGAAAAIGPLPGVGRAVADGLRHGLCVVTGAVCTPAEARAEGLAACPVHLRSNAEDATVSIGIVRLGRHDAFTIERRSDGGASVSFLDGGDVGATAGIGLTFTPLGLEGAASAVGGVRFTAGRTWDFRSWAAADAFVGRHARHETLTGEARDRLRFWDGRHRLPPASAVLREGGAFAEAVADLHLPMAGHGVDVDARLEGVAVLGRRTAGPRQTTYVRVAGESAGRLGAVIGALGTDGAGEAVLELTTDGGRPVALRVSGGAALGANLEVLGTTADVGRLAERLRAARAGAGAGRGGALAAEASVTLDLHDPLNLAATRELFGAFARPAALPGRLAALGSRLDSDGTLDLRVYRAGVQRDETGADAALGVKLGAAYERTERGRSLVAAWTSVGGGTPREREDCTAA